MKNNIFIKCQQQAMTSNHVGVLKLDDGRVLLTADGFTAVVIPQEDLMLDVSRFVCLSKTVLDGIDKVPELKLTCNCRYTTPKIIIRELQSDSGKSVYVNDKYIKFFGTGVSYKGDECKVFVFEKDSNKLIGLILPIHLKED
jgi:hypothetical protein|nr:MAG TPA: hypothetical protein [Caudoviricetes sp.]